MKTAIDDFRHTSCRFYAIFVDFRDAFGSIDQEYLIRILLDSGIEKYYLENFHLQSGQKRETPSVLSYLLSL